jgi:Zn-finger nucleic acid-binding protein
MALICPKCQGEWRQYERNGVTVDQCTECRGIFLDRGELDRLVDAENSWHDSGAAEPGQPPAAPGTAEVPPPYNEPASPPPYSPAPGQQTPPPYPPSQGPPPPYSPPPAYPPQQPGYGYPSHGQPHRKKKSFLDELFD